MKKRILTGLLALCMLCGLTACGGGAGTPASPGAQSTPEPELPEYTSGYAYTDSGSCGDDGVWWGYDGKNKTLVIGGSGYMAGGSLDPDVGRPTTPWSDYAESIQSAIIQDGVRSIGEFAFFGCSNLTSVAIPDSVSSIMGAAFADCTSLTDITIPSSVNLIKEAVFANCASLTSVVIPDNVTLIFSQTFFDCTSLTSVTIPHGVHEIDDRAFSGCTSLTDVYFTGTEEQWATINIIRDDNDPLFNATIHYNSAE